MDKIVIICGPTGSGKTGFAIDLARRFDGEIVGADSMQIYRHMDIGTAKPTMVEQASAVHHMIDLVDPDEGFDAAAYADMASDCIGNIIERGRTVFLVGGTGFYIKALVHGLFEKGPSDPSIRNRIKKEVESYGTGNLHLKLQNIDEASAQKIHPNDTYRIIRALEVYEITGQPLSVFQKRHGFREKRFDTLEIGLSWPRAALYDRINERVDAMMAQGFYDEVKHLLALGYDPNLKSMQSLGYRHLSSVIQGDDELTNAVASLKRDHRRYAKRQLTWFRARDSVVWLTTDRIDTAMEYIDAFIQEKGN